MQVVNTSGLAYGPLLWQRGPDDFAVTVVVKATLRLVADGPAELAEEQCLPAGDEAYEDDDGTGPPRYEFDFAPYKPRADVMAVGTAYAPQRRPVPSFPVSMRIGPVSRDLTVIGERRWVRTFPFAKMSDPRPIERCALRYQQAFGGPGLPSNPVGTGHGSREEDGPQQLPLLEDPAHPIRSPRDKAAPACFGPIPRSWKPRTERMGTYDKRWLKTRWPGYPEDFDWGHFNAAPRSQQVDGFLRGDEAFEFVHLHAEHERLSGQLPGWRARAFVDRRADEDGIELEEVALQLDTLWVDLDADRLVLLWRGTFPVASDLLEDVRYLYLAREPLASPAPLTQHVATLQRALHEDEVEEPASAPPSSAEERTIDEELAAADAALAAAYADAGIEPTELPEEASAEAKAEEAALLEQLGVPSDPSPWDRARVIAAVDSGQELSGQDLRQIDLSGAALKGAALSQARLDGCLLDGCDLSGANLTQASLAGIRGKACKLEGATLDGADLSGADLAEADLRAARLVASTAEAATFVGARFDAAAMNEAELVGARLERAVLTEANLSGADLAGARLDGACFEGADLTEATLENASGEGVNLRGAVLTELRAAGDTRLPGSDLTEARGSGAVWEGADLSGSTLCRCSLPGADFSAARLTDADLSAADLRGASFTRAELNGAKLNQADLFQSALDRATLRNADVRGANLYGSDTAGSVVDGARLDGANLGNTLLGEES